MIGIDLRCLSMDGSPGAGVAHVARGLWHALMTRRDLEIEWRAFIPRGANVCSLSGAMVSLPDDSGSSLRQALSIHRVDALLVPSGAVPWGVRIPVYPWVHDLAIFEHPEWFPQSWFKRQLTTRLFSRGLRHARHVFTVSEETKRQLLRHGFASQDITVVYPGVDLKYEPWNMEREGFALIHGTVEPRKNIPYIVSLWPRVCERLGRTVRLVISGNEGWGQVRIDYVPGIERMARVSDEERERLIASASMVLVPSFYEGFGMTAVEAMSVGTPVITSDGGSLAEVVGDGGVVLPLTQSEKWVEAIVRLFQDAAFHQEWVDRARKRARAFSWDKVVGTMMAEIQKL